MFNPPGIWQYCAAIISSIIIIIIIIIINVTQWKTSTVVIISLFIYHCIHLSFSLLPPCVMQFLSAMYPKELPMYTEEWEDAWTKGQGGTFKERAQQEG